MSIAILKLLIYTFYLVENKRAELKQIALTIDDNEDRASFYKEGNVFVRKSISDVSESLQDIFWNIIRDKTTATIDLGRRITNLCANNFSTIMMYLVNAGFFTEKTFDSALELYIRTHEIVKRNVRKCPYKNTVVRKDDEWQTNFSNYVMTHLNVQINYSAMIGKRSSSYKVSES